jgi:hypothetical protein
LAGNPKWAAQGAASIEAILEPRRFFDLQDVGKFILDLPADS